MLSAQEVLDVHMVSRFDAHDTVTDAIEAGYSELNSDESRFAHQRLVGQRIEGVNWSDSRAEFRFANGLSLHLFASGRQVSWNIVQTVAELHTNESFPRALQLRRSTRKQVTLWNRANILEARVGHPFQRIVHSGSNVFLYVSGCAILFFCILGLKHPSEADSLLMWSDSQ